MTEADYVDDLVLLSNKPTQVESLLKILEQSAGDISLYINTNKAGFVYFKQEEAISPLSGKSLKFADHLKYLGSNIISTENDVNIHRA